ncbi:cache domain-containing protein [Nitrospirillum iridis]|uniref:Signal transduction histidine kinase n=1 Tax=Nitrospirillum iridis TaxID=765888 RepID=A0A7X0AUA5_9PROT|nr:cache domain-containing protein [Nitrospirillum iridis]MBB6250220.1 signal transduction histidine kinase [Nitrospirillum iridis]
MFSRVYLPLVVAIGLATPAWAAGQATKTEAVAMVTRAVAHLKEVGREKALADFSTAGGPYTDRDLYVVVYDLTGTCLAHGANAKLIGKNLSDAEDVDGKLYIQERMALAKANKTFWQDYKFTNPSTKKIEPKEMYCQVDSDLAVCSGIYKQ